MLVLWTTYIIVYILVRVSVCPPKLFQLKLRTPPCEKSIPISSCSNNPLFSHSLPPSPHVCSLCVHLIFSMEQYSTFLCQLTGNGLLCTSGNLPRQRFPWNVQRCEGDCNYNLIQSHYKMTRSSKKLNPPPIRSRITTWDVNPLYLSDLVTTSTTWTGV